jgi:iron complex outermembrane recepter protein
MNTNDLTRIFRCNTLTAAVQNTLDRCSGLFAGSNAIGFINTLTDNVGATKTNGFDIAGSYTYNAGAVGRFALNYNGTRINSYKFQRNPADPFTENVGNSGDTNPVFRWQHLIGVNHQLNNFSTWLIVRNKSGYSDQNAGGEDNHVPAYTVADLSVTYTGFKGFTLTGGIKNVLNQDPPFSNQAVTFQVGYDPRFTDPIGRAYFFRGSYLF